MDTVRLPIARPRPPPIETTLQFWHPGRFGVQYAPAPFRAELQALHPELDITWHPTRERWLVWYKRPRIKLGWLLLLVVEDSAQRYVPLDARLFAAIYEQSGCKWGNGKQYWARVESEAQRERDMQRAERTQEIEDIGSDRWDHTKIQISMCGHSNGSKFVNHHAGD